MASLFLSYRREDSRAICLELAGELMRLMGKPNVFLDIDSIAGGDIFPVRLATALHQSDVVAVLIGPRWLTITDTHGQRRLDLPGDFVRLEVETALAGRGAVVPVLVHGAVLPSPASLPPSLQPLAHRAPLALNDDGDLERVARLLSRQALQAELAKMPRVAFPLLVGTVLLLGALGLPLVIQQLLQAQLLPPNLEGVLSVTFSVVALFALGLGVWRSIQYRLWPWLGGITSFFVLLYVVLAIPLALEIQYLSIVLQGLILLIFGIAGPRLAQLMRLWRLRGS